MARAKIEKTLTLTNAEVVNALGEKFGIPNGTNTRWQLACDHRAETFKLSLFWDDTPSPQQQEMK